MSKITVVAVNKVVGLEPPKKDKEHVLEIGDEYQIEEADAARHIESGALMVKPAAAEVDKEVKP